jgi:hypothetical protein
MMMSLLNMVENVEQLDKEKERGKCSILKNPGNNVIKLFSHYSQVK